MKISRAMQLLMKSMAGVLVAVAVVGGVQPTSLFLFHQPDVPQELRRK
ncbi:MAG: AgrD family cyclic lactone autoinducer peptide [Bacillota bacterium]